MQAFVLYVLWYCPEPASYHPIGRLVRLPHDGEDAYEFVYLNAAAFAGFKYGFQPIGGFPEPAKRYLSDRLFPFFSNRVMSPRRSDYDAYVDSLGFSKAPEDQLLLLTRDGRKATDRFETFGYPDFNQSINKLECHFWLRGIRFQSEDADQRCLDLRPGQQLTAVPDKENEVDPHAVGLHRSEGESRLGYLPNILTREVARLQTEGARPEFQVVHVNPLPVPARQRVLCVFRSDWPDSYAPFVHTAMQPLVSEAWDLHEVMNPRTREVLIADPA